MLFGKIKIFYFAPNELHPFDSTRAKHSSNTPLAAHKLDLYTDFICYAILWR